MKSESVFAEIPKSVRPRSRALYALVAEDTVVDWYVGRDEAYIALRECLSELPDWEDSLVVWRFDFEFNPN